MQKLIFAIIIAAVGAAPSPYRSGTPIPGYQCPQEDIDNTGCKGPKDCLYPNPADCHSFIQCNDAGLAYEMPCAPVDLVYNDTLKECDWESTTPCRTSTTPLPTAQTSEAPVETTATPEAPTTDAQTSEQPISSTTESEVTSESESSTAQTSSAPVQTTTESVSESSSTTAPPSESTSAAPVETTQTPEEPTASPSTQSPTEGQTSEQPIESSTAQTSSAPVKPSTPEPTQGSGFVCPVEDIANTGCKGPTDCLYPNPENCQTFIQCTVNPDNSGTPVVMPCPAGLEWNDNIKRCDYPESSTCPKGSTARPTEQTSEAPVETTLSTSQAVNT
ncbi:unnamed protein product [Oppiella nova]|uniref:Chitin-binding type-2 domain-containing protein n=1 Tax=Oppiella nova TaxID=334625 RepID=A0A7R9LRQ4_9ACAR|nr:unnamed protein product [Oppiella nova]CAG2166321.1 unnamed protein product [Oppiella nova]